MLDKLQSITIDNPTKHIGDQLPQPRITLDKLYKDGWWITEIFGSYANIVKISSCSSRKSKRPYFMCVSVLIDVDKITKGAMQTINKIKNQQWKKYKHLMEHKDEKNKPTT